MEYTGERQIPKVPGTLIGLDIKHTDRYKWASTYTHGKVVYDIACGSGYAVLLLESSSYSGFDNSQSAVEYANKYYKKNKPTNFSVQDACDMPDLTPCDVIVSFETIEHIQKPNTFLEWCSKHTKILIISSPVRGSYGRSRFHLFEYKFEEFEKVLNKYFSSVTMFIQKDNVGIIYPAKPNDKGVAIGICLT